jgi:hypothetical protein
VSSTSCSPERADSLLKREEREASSGILPFTESKDFVLPTDPRYRFLAGNGEPLEGCGKWMYRGCLEVDQHSKYDISMNQLTLDGEPAKKFAVVQAYKASCGRLACPICLEKACAKEAAKVAHRVMSFKAPRRMLPFHVVVSVPLQDQYLPYREIRNRAMELAKKAGVLGGSLLFHPYRKYDEPEEEEDLQPDFSVLDSPGSWYVSPHFHLLGYGWIHGKKVKAIHDQSGWVIRNLGVRKPLPGQTLEDAVRATAHYQLSHCGVHPHFHTVTWFGALAYNKLKVSPEPPEKHECPLCGSELQKVEFVHSEDQAIVESSLQEEGVFLVPEGIFQYCRFLRDPGG